MKKSIKCQNCGCEVYVYKNPFPTVDVIIHNNYSEIVLVKRKNPPFGWALPGGFVDYGETVEEAAIREAKEETFLDVELEFLLGVYSHPSRDPRQHNISVVFVAKSFDFTPLRGGDDAKEARLFSIDDLPDLVFDHMDIISDYKDLLRKGKRGLISFGRTVCGGK